VLEKTAGVQGEHWGDAEGVMIEPKSGLRLGASDPRSSDARAIGY
jgi:hypothetical protein